MAEETIVSTGWSPTDADPLEGGRIWSLPPGVKFEHDPFTVGGQLELRSGGPAMTVRTILGDSVYVEWFLDGKVHHGAFPRQMLKAHETPHFDPEAELARWKLSRRLDAVETSEQASPAHSDWVPTLIGFAGGFLTAALFGWLQ